MERRMERTPFCGGGGGGGGGVGVYQHILYSKKLF